MENEIYETVEQENDVEVCDETCTSSGSKIGAVLGGAALAAGVIGTIALIKKGKAKKQARAVEDAKRTLEAHGYDTSVLECGNCDEVEVVDAE